MIIEAASAMGSSEYEILAGTALGCTCRKAVMDALQHQHLS